MKWLNKLGIVSLCAMTNLIIMSACGEETFDMPYGSMADNDAFCISSESGQARLDFFAEEYAATSKDITEGSTFDPSALYAACLYDVANKEVVYSYKATDRVNPASLTKIMTALVVLDACNSGVKSLDETITLGDVTISESGAQTLGLKQGDRIMVRDLFNLSLVYSGNDASLALAQYVAGSEEAFVELMNTKAVELGCTGTHFYNSNGLTNEDHYTTAYDLYMMFSAAMKYADFQNAIGQSSYSCTYINANGEQKEKTVPSTNKFLTGDYSMSEGIFVYGGKTGSTNAAGKCLLEYMTDSENHPYICIIMGASDEDTLYKNMRALCSEFLH